MKFPYFLYFFFFCFAISPFVLSCVVRSRLRCLMRFCLRRLAWSVVLFIGLSALLTPAYAEEVGSVAGVDSVDATDNGADNSVSGEMVSTGIVSEELTAEQASEEIVSAEQSLEEQAPSLIVPASLQALWAAGGVTDFSDAAWQERLGICLNRWDGIAGEKVSDLTQSEIFYGIPAAAEKLLVTEFSPPQAIANTANGIRMRGVLVIPEDGAYSFAMASDDSSELWMGEPETPQAGSRFTKKKLLSIPQWINPRDWTQYNTPERQYKAGDIVWIELLGKNKEGLRAGEHASIAWKKPGETSYGLIPAKLDSGRVVLSIPPPSAEDPEDIGVPQSWLASVGLGMIPAGQAQVRLYGDTDNDGFNLLEEYQTGGRPDEVGGNTGYFVKEKWTNTTEGSVAAFTVGERFLESPNEKEKYTGALDLTENDKHYCNRLRAHLVPPIEGEWIFYMAANDSARLLLSPNSQRFAKRSIVEILKDTPPYDWSHMSEPQNLESGEPYFLEALQYQISGAGHLSIAWRHNAPNLSRLPGTVASQSTQYGENPASYAIDGDKETQSHTQNAATPSWWQMEFVTPQDMNQVVLYNRTDHTNVKRLSNFRVSVLDEDGAEIAGQDFFTEAGTYAGPTLTWDLSEKVKAKSIKVQGLGANAQGNRYLCLKEVEVYAHNDYSRHPVIIASQYLKTHPLEPNDKDNNSLPDDWQVQVGLIPGQSGLSEKDCSEYGDPDNDLIPNFAEYILTSNPLLPSGVPGYLTQEMWLNVAGWSVDDAMKSPDVLGITPTRDLLKKGQPARNVGENYFRRLRGTITVPATGDYTFWLSSDETSILYLSTNERKFQKKEIARVGYSATDRGAHLAAYNQWDAYPKQRSLPVHLETGKEYFIEIDHKQYHAIDHLQIAWQLPGGEREEIPAQYLRSFGGDLADRDDDDLPDDWETQYGIDPGDNGSKEFNNGAWGDPYDTGITNREAYLSGAIAPPQPPTETPQPPVLDIPGNSATVVAGSWSSVGDKIICAMGSGELSYTVNIPDNKHYLLEVSGTPSGNLLTEESISIQVKYDDLFVGSVNLRSIQGAPAKGQLLLPPVTPGSHTVTLILINTDLRRAFAIDGIRIIIPEGVDTGNHGLPDWLYNQLHQENLLTACPEMSLTSPVCVEGKSRLREFTQLSVQGVLQEISPAAGRGWYANVALLADGAPITVQTRFESGAFSENKTISWSPCNMLTYSNLLLRAGDSVRLTVDSPEIPEGTLISYTVNGVVLNSAPRGETIVCTFPAAQQYTVSASWSAEGVTTTRTLYVNAQTIEMNEPSDIYIGRARYFLFKNLPSDIVFQTDEPLHTVETKIVSPTEKKITLIANKDGLHYLVARLGAGGPILATKPLRCHLVNTASTLSGMSTVETFEDGSKLGRMFISVKSLPPGGYIEVRFQAGGIQFLDGGVTKKLYIEDFDELGLACILFTLPKGTETSACHQIYFFDAHGNAY